MGYPNFTAAAHLKFPTPAIARQLRKRLQWNRPFPEDRSPRCWVVEQKLYFPISVEVFYTPNLTVLGCGDENSRLRPRIDLEALHIDWTVSLLRRIIQIEVQVAISIKIAPPEMS